MPVGVLVIGCEESAGGVQWAGGNVARVEEGSADARSMRDEQSTNTYMAPCGNARYMCGVAVCECATITHICFDPTTQEHDAA